jgi:hypothetical protein
MIELVLVFIRVEVGGIIGVLGLNKKAGEPKPTSLQFLALLHTLSRQLRNCKLTT